MPPAAELWRICHFDATVRFSLPVDKTTRVQLFLSFGMMFASLLTLPSELRMLLKERSSSMYRLSAFYVSRTFATLPLDLLYPCLFVTIVYWLGGLRQEVCPLPRVR